jgi:hypothetical protein
MPLVVAEFAEKPSLTAKFLSIDGLATRTVTSGEITSLKHEIFDHAVKFGSLVSNNLAVLFPETHCEFAEILASYGDDIVVQLENDALGGALADLNIELSLLMSKSINRSQRQTYENVLRHGRDEGMVTNQCGLLKAQLVGDDQSDSGSDNHHHHVAELFMGKVPVF